MQKAIIIIQILLLLSVRAVCQSQDRMAEGVITDAATGKPLEFINVYFKHTTNGTISDSKGRFTVSNTKGADTLVVESIGYKKYEYKLKKTRELNLSIAIEQEALVLAETYVWPKRESYRNKGNPAVELIRKVIKNSDNNRIESEKYYSSDIYEKITLSLENVNQELLKKEKYNFLAKYVNNSDVTGNSTLMLSIRENNGKVYHRNHPRTRKIVRTAQRLEGIDEEIDLNGSFTATLEQILTEINIFNNEISFLANRFVSPLSKLQAVSFYKYYIQDTVTVNGSKCVDLAFVPRNPESFGFTGRMYVVADSSYAVKRIHLNFPAKSNVNWVSKLNIDQEFEQNEDGLWALSREDAYVNFDVVDSWQGILAHCVRCYEGYKVDPGLESRRDIFNTDELVIRSKSLKEDRDSTFWYKSRFVPLTEQEVKVGNIKSELNNKTNLTTWTRIIDAFLSEWVPVKYPKDTSPFNFGPILSFAAYDYIEKLRIKVGGMTTANLSDRWFANGYLAYGIGDKKFKGEFELIHSFFPKEYHSQESLRNNLSFSFTYDIYTPDSYGVNRDIATSLEANSVKTYQYVRKAELKYERQWTNGLTTEFAVAGIQMTPATTSDPGSLSYRYYNQNGQIVNVPNITTTELSLFLRWAPGERSTNAINKKMSIDKDTPIFTLQHRIGIPDVLGGQYFYNRTDFSVFKRFRLSFAGFLDMKVYACKVWDKVPWPLLSHPSVNSSFSYRRERFNTMAPLEFIMDQYLQWNLTWHMKGMIFNRIPLLKRTSLREILIFNGLWGNLSDKNNPAMNQGQFILPLNSSPIGETPFMEVGAGLENIFKCYRIVYFQRLNYGMNEHRSAGFWSGFRLGISLDF